MQFDYQFILVFLPAAIAGYWVLMRFLGRSGALGWLLLASIGFYVYTSPKSLAIIAPSILSDYLIARWFFATRPSDKRLRKFLVTVGITANVVFLGYYKYANFFLDTANTLFELKVPLTKLILPLGISFLTFQKIAFLADIQSGQVKDVRLSNYLLFTLFFPRTVAGPIVRYAEIMPQFAEVKLRNIKTDLAVGLCLFSIGLVKKTVIADGVAPYVWGAFDPGWLSDYPPSMLTAWTGVLAYTFQLYFDFSGYSDIALGTARMFGVRLPMNFNSPFKATSIVQFWTRWHITLTRFLTSYVANPIVLRLTRARLRNGKPLLSGSSTTFSALAVLVGLPTLVTMTLSGLWHGAGWQFVAWGTLHGIYLTINQGWRMLRPRFWPHHVNYERVMKPVGFVLTFSAVVISLALFRAPSIASAWPLLKGMAGMNGALPHYYQVLHNMGSNGSWQMIWQDLTPLKWIALLFLITTVLPNSLELLRRFHPAVDFPLNRAMEEDGTGVSGGLNELVQKKTRSIGVSLLTKWVTFQQLGEKGLVFSHSSAVFMAILLILGLMALTHSTGFIYLEF